MIRVLFDNTTENIPAENKIKWIDLLSPSHTEIKKVCKAYDLDVEFLTAALDPNERARHEIDNGKMLLIIRFPVENEEEESPENEDEETYDLPYRTYPMGIILAPNIIITVSLVENPIIESLATTIERRQEFNVTDFVLYTFHKVSLMFLKFLREIDEAIQTIEKDLQQYMQNDDILRLLHYQKVLVYFSTSLRNNDFVLKRLRNSSIMREATGTQIEFYEDIQIDMAQAVETANIYSDIIMKIADAFSSIISNNLNQVMKTLTALTLAIALPTLISSIYGMNIKLPLQDNPYAFEIIILLSLSILIIGFWWINKKF